MVILHAGIRGNLRIGSIGIAVAHTVFVPDGTHDDTPGAVDETGDFGFSAPAEHKPAHLPQPEWFAQYAVDIEETEKDSMLKFYRRALAARAELLTATGDTTLTWADGYDDQVIAYRRPTADGRTLTSVTNFGAFAVQLPAGEVFLASAALVDGKLPTDATVWVVA